MVQYKVKVQYKVRVKYKVRVQYKVMVQYKVRVSIRVQFMGTNLTGGRAHSSSEFWEIVGL